MIIFGWGGRRSREIGPVAALPCPACHNETVFRLHRSSKWFKLYFVPLVPYGTKRALLCPVCGRGAMLSSSQADQAKGLILARAAVASGDLDESAYLDRVHAFVATLAPVFGVAPARRVALGAGRTATAPSPGWYPDPAGRHERRYWDGGAWTDHVDDHGVPATDPAA